MTKRLVVAIALVVGVASVGVSASAMDSPSKKYCKNHKKKCRKNLKGSDGRGGVKKKRGNWSKGIDAGWQPSTNQPNNEPGAWLHRIGAGQTDCTGTPNNNGYWCLNGGPKAKRGCRNITGYSLRLGRAFDNNLYQLNLQSHWCFRRGKVKNNNQLWANSYLSNMHWSADDQGYVDGAQVNEFYRYGKKAHGGHFWQRQNHIKLCIAWAVGCIYNRYPWVRVYAHGNGTWHASGNVG